MEAIEFKQQTQIAGSEVIDANGVCWLVKKDIIYAGYTIAEPSEGEFYSRVNYSRLISELTTRLTKAEEQLAAMARFQNEPMDLNANDFYIEELNGVNTIRVK